MSAILNVETTGTGKVRAVCEWCGRQSKPVDPLPDGRPGFLWFAGWSECPFPDGHVHADGSRGTTYTCRGCRLVADRRQAAGIQPLLSPTPERAAAIRARGHAPNALAGVVGE